MKKTWLKKVFPQVVEVRNRIINYVAHYRFKGAETEDVFKIIYEENLWGDHESKSGTGSNHKNTLEVINILNRVVNDFRIKTILDLPCGDFNWMKHVDLNRLTYKGGDIVDQVIKSNQQNLSKSNISFMKLDILSSELPKVDLIVTRDCLVHFSYSNISRAIANVKRSGSTYWLTTTFPKHRNHNIITGDWRPVNLQAVPFNLPQPVLIYNEQCSEDDRYNDKSLALWRIIDI